MGILEPITPGNLFPICPSPAEADALDGTLWTKGNHPSFGTPYGEDNAVPGLEVLDGYYTKGYAARYSSMFEAEKIHGDILISPLGNLTKNKPDGSLKHRIIQDLRRGGANLLAALFERIVLPRPNDHGWDLYNLWKEIATGELSEEASVWSLIVDFEDAFMSTGTLPSEQKYTAAQVDDPSSPTGIYVYVWYTLGFGGKTFPLVYARPASFASRTAQALLDPKRARLQLYVDDPVLSLYGDEAMGHAGSRPTNPVVVSIGAQAVLEERVLRQWYARLDWCQIYHGTRWAHNGVAHRVSSSDPGAPEAAVRESGIISGKANTIRFGKSSTNRVRRTGLVSIYILPLGSLRGLSQTRGATNTRLV